MLIIGKKLSPYALLSISGLLAASDQAVKWLVQQSMAYGEYVSVTPFFNWVHLWNTSTTSPVKSSAQTSTAVVATTPTSTETSVVASSSGEAPVASTSFTVTTPQTLAISTTASGSIATTQMTPLTAVSTPLMVSVDSPKSVASPQTRSHSFTNVLESSH